MEMEKERFADLSRLCRVDKVKICRPREFVDEISPNESEELSKLFDTKKGLETKSDLVDPDYVIKKMEENKGSCFEGLQQDFRSKVHLPGCVTKRRVSYYKL